MTRYGVCQRKDCYVEGAICEFGLCSTHCDAHTCSFHMKGRAGPATETTPSAAIYEVLEDDNEITLPFESDSQTPKVFLTPGGS